jgi:hypothetical protein
MLWDLLLIAVVLYNTVHSARRGGRAVGLELLAFAITYAVTLTLAPVLAGFVKGQWLSPPPLISVLCTLAIYLGTRRLLKTLRETGETTSGSEVCCEGVFIHRSPRHASGAFLGLVRGTVIAAALAMVGCSLASVQEAGFLRFLPPARESVSIHEADRLMDRLVLRYTRGTGPTTRALVDLARHPEREKLERFLQGPFVQRLKRSEAVVAFASDQEVKHLIQSKRTGEVLMHPAFLRVLSVTLRELQHEEPVPAGPRPVSSPS